ncbi:hypothetical protein AVEN_16796-1 [Araneus ventricosus]|uniref:Helitron helicase-like domain-containing protein n=1 Tax=Araneus ventricosus TaxID=182803 RepID=A0A4Y2BPY9_ARAVE|nr:hypothetical protein AVEN_16796-1 [Araneus ventricosus]
MSERSKGMLLICQFSSRTEFPKSCPPLVRERETQEERQNLLAVSEEYRKRIHQQQSQGIINQSLYFCESQVETQYCGPMNVICEVCKSKNFLGERPSDNKFTICCRKGKFKLQKSVDSEDNILKYPGFLKDLMSNIENPCYTNFREHISSYNSAVSFALMGTKLVDLNGRGPYMFKVHGQIFHRTSHLQPIDGESPQYVQLYVIDSTQATEVRISHPANETCLFHILYQIDKFFRQHNRFSVTYRMLHEIEAQAPEEAYVAGEGTLVVNMMFRRDCRSDQRRYNAPKCNEITMVFGTTF